MLPETVADGELVISPPLSVGINTGVLVASPPLVTGYDGKAAGTFDESDSLTGLAPFAIGELVGVESFPNVGNVVLVEPPSDPFTGILSPVGSFEPRDIIGAIVGKALLKVGDGSAPLLSPVGALVASESTTIVGVFPLTGISLPIVGILLLLGAGRIAVGALVGLLPPPVSPFSESWLLSPLPRLSLGPFTGCLIKKTRKETIRIVLMSFIMQR